jgi:exopolysaccharide biosynthesis polyprenyl glycosylphosphotransferase
MHHNRYSILSDVVCISESRPLALVSCAAVELRARKVLPWRCRPAVSSVHQSARRGGRPSPVTAQLSHAPPATLPSATVESDRAARTNWAVAYVRPLAVTDAVSIISTVGIAQWVRFGADPASLSSSASMISYTLISVVLVVAWFAALVGFRSRDVRVVGSGAEEYRRVAHASFALFGSVAIVAFLLKLDLARGYLAVALPLGLATLVVSRWLWRRWLVRRRAEGHFTSSVLVVGSHHAASAMAALFERDRKAGYRVIGVCVPGSSHDEGALNVRGHRVPVLGDEQAILTVLQTTGADMVAVSNTESLGADGMRALAWQLEAVDVDLVVSSGVVDVAGPRLQIRPVAGLPLLHVDKPQYRGASKVGKILIDLTGAAAVLLLLSPLFVLVSVLIKVSSRGPVFYRAERIGLKGQPFNMLKFRSMAVGAEGRRLELVKSNEAAGPLFKMRNDPRVTRVGRWIRRLSIDELPQLFNVLCGHMSVVGPRPPLRSEVVTYSGDVHRRLLVKPGITGLWQVSGRSDLTWEESVRLDLFYVENWSIIQDMTIVWRTLGAVISSRGAY